MAYSAVGGLRGPTAMIHFVVPVAALIHLRTCLISPSLLHMLVDPLEQESGDLVAVGVPHHDVVVAPDAGLRNLVEQRRPRQFRQRMIDRIAARLSDLRIGLKARAGIGPADLIDAVN